MLDSRSGLLRDLRLHRWLQLPVYLLHAEEIFGRDYAFLPRVELLTFEEITRLATAFASEGVSKIRLTGGEPLLRRDLEHLIAMLATVDGITDIALTTNGSTLAGKARTVKDAWRRQLSLYRQANTRGRQSGSRPRAAARPPSRHTQDVAPAFPALPLASTVTDLAAPPDEKHER